MPKPKDGESQKDFVKRCVPIVMADGSAKDNKQAVAMCYSMYRQGKKAMNEGKHGGMHTAKEMDHLQAIHDHAVNLGADCGDGGEEMKRLSPVAMKYMMDVGAQQYAVQESWDIQVAANALISIAGMVSSEVDEPDDMVALGLLLKGLLEFIGGEIDEMLESASKSGPDDEEESDDNDDEQKNTLEDAGEMDPDEAQEAIQQAFGKAISKREDTNPKEGTSKYGDVKFADEKNKKYPIDTEEHIRAAWNYINKSGNAGKYSAEEVAQIKRKIVAAWKDKIDKAGPPSAEEKKSINLSYVKSLGLTIPSKELAVKYIGKDEIKSYNFLWGNAGLTDVETEYFTKQSNFWDNVLGQSPRPLTWDHGQDETFKGSAVIGQINEWGDDDLGRWYAAKLDRSHRYRKMIDRLIEEGVLGTSSDSAPQYVIRERTGKSIWLKQWPWFASALTDVPCEPRMIGSIEMLKSWGVTLPADALDVQARWLATLKAKAQSIDAEARILQYNILKGEIDYERQE